MREFYLSIRSIMSKFIFSLKDFDYRVEPNDLPQGDSSGLPLESELSDPPSPVVLAESPQVLDAALLEDQELDIADPGCISDPEPAEVVDRHSEARELEHTESGDSDPNLEELFGTTCLAEL